MSRNRGLLNPEHFARCQMRDVSGAGPGWLTFWLTDSS
jgi:hypothetical protein